MRARGNSSLLHVSVDKIEDGAHLFGRQLGRDGEDKIVLLEGRRGLLEGEEECVLNGAAADAKADAALLSRDRYETMLHDHLRVVDLWAPLAPPVDARETPFDILEAFNLLRCSRCSRCEWQSGLREGR